MAETRTQIRRRGAVALVFDAQEWGGKDVGDNSQFWHPATILNVRGQAERQVATVRFHHDGRVSHGHFTMAMRDV